MMLTIFPNKVLDKAYFHSVILFSIIICFAKAKDSLTYYPLEIFFLGGGGRGTKTVKRNKR